MNRIETALQALQEKKEKAFITYITAGLPDYDKTKAIIKAQEAAGTDIIELGIPFSDPVADGPVIQAASYEAILGGTNLEKTFTCMKEMRDDGVQIPIVFMMYYNTVLHYGVEKFVKECNACGVDGLIIPDLPLEEQEELQTQLQKEDGTILIQLVSPVSKDRVPKILKNARGCLLCVFHGSYRTGSNLPPSDFRIPDGGKERGKNSGYDGIWYPHGGGCTSDERDY